MHMLTLVSVVIVTLPVDTGLLLGVQNVTAPNVAVYTRLRTVLTTQTRRYHVTPVL